MRPYGVVRIDSACRSRATGLEDPDGKPAADRRDISPGVPDRRRPRRATGRRGRDLLGRHAHLEEDGRSARDRSIAPRHSASRPTWPTRYSICWATTLPRIAILPSGLRLDRRSSFDEAYRQMTDVLRPWTNRFSRRPERRHRVRQRLARQDRPALPGHRSQRQARHRRHGAATGCATTARRARRTDGSNTSAGMAACSPTTS